MTEVKTKRQSASLDRRKLLADPIMVTTIVVLITFLTLFILYPLAILLVDSFYSKNGLTLDIFKRVLAIRTSIANTLKVGFLVGILSTLLGLLFAYVEVYVKLGKFSGGLFKVVSMLPVVSPPFVLSLSMIMLFGKAGLITRFLLKIYDNNVYGFWGIAIVSIWQWTGYTMIIYVAGINSISADVQEAAMLDGATGLQKFFRVTLPLIMPSVTICLFWTITRACTMFDLPFALTAGGPFRSSETIAMNIYTEAFTRNNYGLGSAKAMLFFAAVLIVAQLQVFVTSKQEVQA